jgi:hypothetical protein
MVHHTAQMNHDFKTLLKPIIDICLIKGGPQSLPESQYLLKLFFVAYFLSGAVLLSSSLSYVEACSQSFIDAVLVGIFIYALTRFFYFQHRYTQSLTAIYGGGAVITLVSTPFFFWLEALSVNEKPTGAVSLVVFLIVCWSFIVMANIIRETIHKGFPMSLLLTFCYLYVSYQVINFLCPATS